MDNGVKVLVIVPVYNSEAYLRKCLDSLVQQTLQEILIMVINDGATDNSQEIIDEYVGKYPQKVVGYVKKNEGPGPARNYGIEKAMQMLPKNRLNEFYLSFVDSDDWLENEALELMYNEALKKNADIVFGDTLLIMNSQTMVLNNAAVNSNVCLKGFRGTEIDDPAQQIMKSNVFTVWNKLYRFTLFNNIRFPGIYHEDTATAPLLFREAKKVSYLPVTFYNYVRRGDSITGSGNGGIHLKPDALKAVNILLDYASAHDDDIILQFVMGYYVEILLGYKDKPLDNYNDYEALNNALCKKLSEKAISAFQDAAIRKIQMIQPK